MLKAPAAWLLGLLLLIGVFVGQPALAQDTVSTADIQFTPVEEAAPAAKATDSVTAVAPTTASPATATTAASPAEAATPASQPGATPAPVKSSLWVTFLAGLLGGFAAVLMPCIFPLLPMTVSFFTKRSGTRARGIRNALVYGASIIVIYVALGLLITVVFGADALNNLATNGIFNFFFFLLLVVFGASFLGAFEIMLPTAWANKMDEKADKGGLLGIFFMAATLALVSFSCTGPIIGTLLVQAATMGQLLGPAVGMFGFALALSLPFTLFSLFPGWMASLPKSGGWLNSVKVTLGFLELAFALKFLSNVDLAYHWQWFDREVFLVLWIVIFGMMGLYLLGKLRFSHDSDLPFITLPRLFLSIIVLSFTLYLVPGLWGAPLRAVSAFLPPQDTQDFDLYTPSLLAPAGGSAVAPASTAPHKYADLFHAPLGLPAFFDYDEGMAYAKQVGKPVLIDFTGHACVNCRKMEANVWPDKQVLPLLRDKYVLIQLYVDDKTELPAAEQTVSKLSGKTLKTIGNKYSDLQASRFNTNSQPYYVLLGRKGNVLVPPQGADYEVENFVSYLNSGLKAY
ncbi:MAG: protein-disulfide reductase DsbD family protein [Janthinobacterium lividum]